MYCEQCGQLLTEEVRFCPECGAKQEGDGEGKNAKVKNRKYKWFLWISILIVIVLGGVGIGFYVANGEVKYQTISEEWLTYNEEGIVSSWGERYKEDISRVRENADGSAFAYLTVDDELFYTDASLRIKKIEEDVDAFCISYTGNNIAYCKNVNENGYGELFLYSVKDEESVRIDTNVLASRLELSPEGTQIAYIKLNGKTSELYKGGLNVKSKKIDSGDIRPLGINDKGDCAL